MTTHLLTTLGRDRLDRHYRDGSWKSDTFYKLVANRAERSPDKFAIRDRARRLTYRQLVQEADALARALQHRGTRPGQRIAVWVASRIEVAIALLACSRNGYVCCPSLHRDHTVNDVTELLRKVRASVLIAQRGFGADAEKNDIVVQAGTIASIRHIYVLGSVDEHNGTPLSLPWSQDAAAEANPVRPDDNPDSVVYLAFTSGTTGVPKGVMHSDNTLLANARTISRDWTIDEKANVYTLGTLSHNLGFGAMIMTLIVGGEIIVHDLPKGASLLDRLKEVGATFLFGVPTHAIDLLSEMRGRKALDLPKLAGFRVSGASAPAWVISELLSHGIKPQAGYGMTETCSHQYTHPNDEARLLTETVGRACEGYEIKIWNTENASIEMPVGEIGEIGGRGASLMLGYFNDQTATEDSFNAHGWFMTSDLGWIDENGYLRITGRKKDVINRGGHKIFPAKLEAIASQHHSIERVAAIPVADARLGEKVCLAVEFRNGEKISAKDILEHLNVGGLSKYDMPEYFLELDRIPLTASGKIRKVEIVEAVKSGRQLPVAIR
ncbi:MAG: class I adenylate-forming enzyme family protein [Magnetospirillum sp.]|nr:class I adenylate-forming enzyme family protein [Magnetospirillum sp.]